MDKVAPENQSEHTPQGVRLIGGVRLAGTSPVPPRTTYVGPGDIVSAATAWWGLRAYDAAVAGNKAANICRASDSTCEDVDTLGNGSFDTATAASFCTSTTCSVKTLYDQTGNGHDLTETTTSEQPALTFNCIGSLPCMTFDPAASQQLQTAQFVTDEPYTISAIADYTGPPGSGGVILADYNDVVGILDGDLGGDNEWEMSATNNEYITGNGDPFHAMEGVFNTSSSNGYLDGTSNPEDTGADFPIGSNGYLGIGDVGEYYFEGDVIEVGLWASAFTGTEAGNVNSNQHSYWGF